MSKPLRLKDLMGLSDEEREKRITEFLAQEPEPLPPPRECPQCYRWFHFMNVKCPDEEDHETLGIRCCHWGDLDAKEVR